MSGDNLESRLFRAACLHYLDGRLNPAEMKALCYLIAGGYTTPHYFPASRWEEVADALGIQASWFSRTLRGLYRSGILDRDHPGHLPGYAVRPQWAPVEE